MFDYDNHTTVRYYLRTPSGMFLDHGSSTFHINLTKNRDGLVGECNKQHAYDRRDRILNDTGFEFIVEEFVLTRSSDFKTNR